MELVLLADQKELNFCQKAYHPVLEEVFMSTILMILSAEAVPL
jgi:hypothetical protein